MSELDPKEKASVAAYEVWAKLRNRGFLSEKAADTGPNGMSGSVAEILTEAITAYLSTVSPLSDGDGWQLVPREPTEAMVDAFVVEMASESIAFDEFSPPIYPAKCYRAMLAAALLAMSSPMNSPITDERLKREAGWREFYSGTPIKAAWMEHTTHKDWMLDGHAIKSDDRIWLGLDWSRAWVDLGLSIAGNPGPYWHVPFPEDETSHRLYPRLLFTKWLTIVRQAVDESVARERTSSKAELLAAREALSVFADYPVSSIGMDLDGYVIKVAMGMQEPTFNDFARARALSGNRSGN